MKKMNIEHRMGKGSKGARIRGLGFIGFVEFIELLGFYLNTGSQDSRVRVN